MVNRPKLKDLIKRKVITPPFKIYAKFKGQEFMAEIDKDGFVILNGTRYTSLSIAAGIVKANISGKPKNGCDYRNANGWTFWCYFDSEGNKQKMTVLRNS